VNLSRAIDYNVLLIHIKHKPSLKIKQGHRSRGKGAFAPIVKRGWAKLFLLMQTTDKLYHINMACLKINNNR